MLHSLFCRNFFGHFLAVSEIGNNSQLKLVIYSRVDQNPLHCDCETLWLTEVLRDKSTESTSSPAASCRTPAQLSGRAVATLTAELLHCGKTVDPYLLSSDFPTILVYYLFYYGTSTWFVNPTLIFCVNLIPQHYVRGCRKKYWLYLFLLLKSRNSASCQ